MSDQIITVELLAFKFPMNCCCQVLDIVSLPYGVWLWCLSEYCMSNQLFFFQILQLNPIYYFNVILLYPTGNINVENVENALIHSNFLVMFSSTTVKENLMSIDNLSADKSFCILKHGLLILIVIILASMGFHVINLC